MNLTTAIYIRSNDKNERLSQKEKLTKLAKEYNHHDIIIYEEDTLYSGLDTDRIALKRLLNNTELGKHNVVLVKDITRFSRDFKKVNEILNSISKSGVTIITEEKRLVIDPNSQEILVGLFTGLINAKETGAQRVKQALNRRAQAGYFNGGQIFGYDNVNKRLVVNQAESKVVKEIFKFRAKGKGYSFIAKYLNEKKLTTRQMNPFSLASVKRILNNEVYVGLIKYRNFGNQGNMCFISGVHEPIISKELWEKVKVVEHANRVPREKRNNN